MNRELIQKERRTIHNLQMKSLQPNPRVTRVEELRKRESFKKR